MRWQYRISWLREGWYVPKRKRYMSLAQAKKYEFLLQSKYCQAFGLNPDDYFCCSGRECACGGETNGDTENRLKEKHKDLPKILWIKYEKRQVSFSKWADV